MLSAGSSQVARNRRSRNGGSSGRPGALVAGAHTRNTPPFCPSLELTFRGHKSAVLAACFQPFVPLSHQLSDGLGKSGGEVLPPYILSSGADGSVFLWSTKPTVRALRFVGHRGPVSDCAWSAGSQLVASAGHDGFVRLWLPSLRRSSSLLVPSLKNNGENCCLWRAHAGPVRSLAMAPHDNYIYTAGDDKAVKCWDLNFVSSRSAAPGKFGGHKFVYGLTGGHQNWVRSVAVSSGEGLLPSRISLVASGGDDRIVQVWDTRTRRPTHTFYEHMDSVRSVDFHPDGLSIATGSADHTVNVFDLRRNMLLQHYDAHNGVVNEVRFSPSGSWLLSASSDGTAKLWDLKEGYLYCTLNAHEGAVHSARFTNDGRYFTTTGQDGLVMVWQSGLLRMQQAYSAEHGAHRPSDASAASPQVLGAGECSAGKTHSRQSGARSDSGCKHDTTEEGASTFHIGYATSVSELPASRPGEVEVGAKAAAKESKLSGHTAPSGSAKNLPLALQKPPLAQPPPSRLTRSMTVETGLATREERSFSMSAKDGLQLANGRSPIDGNSTTNCICRHASDSELLGRVCEESEASRCEPRNSFSCRVGSSMCVHGAQGESRYQREIHCGAQERPLVAQDSAVPHEVRVSDIRGPEVEKLDKLDDEMTVLEYVGSTYDGATVEYSDRNSILLARDVAHHGTEESMHNAEDRLKLLECAYTQLVEQVQQVQGHTAEIVQRQQREWERERQQHRVEMDQLRVMMEGLVRQQEALLEAIRQTR
ncbi:WD domain [Trypanosoma vivax]|uniref:Uncharacterized protein n=1 Tax=Trypanosoma vivax (strain Y486) TaxID=1055687 RepID=G0U5T3_TRYVY|nr:hypothetical protein TRVL_03793 [Trypanosoma vivax]KAH8608008.1 WD domain [Trypanosoma vivax]CCC51234.1 conserved hypothetical protein [Trypanosoma vivax Y486]